MAEKTKAELQADNEALEKRIAELMAAPSAPPDVAKLQARVVELEASAASGNPFTGNYREQFAVKVAAGLTAEQATAVVKEQIASDKYEADKKAKAEAEAKAGK